MDLEDIVMTTFLVRIVLWLKHCFLMPSYLTKEADKCFFNSIMPSSLHAAETNWQVCKWKTDFPVDSQSLDLSPFSGWKHKPRAV